MKLHAFCKWLQHEQFSFIIHVKSHIEYFLFKDVLRHIDYAQYNGLPVRITLTHEPHGLQYNVKKHLFSNQLMDGHTVLRHMHFHYQLSKTCRSTCRSK